MFHFCDVGYIFGSCIALAHLKERQGVNSPSWQISDWCCLFGSRKQVKNHCQSRNTGFFFFRKWSYVHEMQELHKLIGKGLNLSSGTYFRGLTLVFSFPNYRCILILHIHHNMLYLIYSGYHVKDLNLFTSPIMSNMSFWGMHTIVLFTKDMDHSKLKCFAPSPYRGWALDIPPMHCVYN